MFFFFQAEDGIRDLTVTGVQTCALPIYLGDRSSLGPTGCLLSADSQRDCARARRSHDVPHDEITGGHGLLVVEQGDVQIGRAACRGKGEISVGAGSIKKKKKDKESLKEL